MKIIKIIAAISLALIIIGVVGIVLVFRYVNPNQFKPLIIEEVATRTGYKLVLEGDLSWSFYPHIGISVAKMVLYEPGKAEPILIANSANMAAPWKPWLSGQKQFNGKINAEKIQAFGLRAKAVSFILQWQDKGVWIKSLNANMYKGTVSGDIQITNLNKLPAWTWSLRLAEVQMQPLIQDWLGKKTKLQVSGVGSATFNGKTIGNTKDALLKNLIGNSIFSLNSGALIGVDVQYYIDSANALIQKKPIPPKPFPEQTPFGSFSGTAQIANGKAVSNDLFLDAPAFSVKGQGNVSLLTQDINCGLGVNLKRIKLPYAIPLLITGTLEQPDVRLDTTGLAKVFTKEQIENAKTKLRKVIEKNVDGDVGKLLQNFLK